MLFSYSRWTSGVAPLPAHSHPEAAGLPWGPTASAVHRLLPGWVCGAAVASRWPRCDHAGGQRCLRGGDPSSRLLPANQVLTEQRGRDMSWKLVSSQLIHPFCRSWNTQAGILHSQFFFNYTFNSSQDAQRDSLFTHCLLRPAVLRSNSWRQLPTGAAIYRFVFGSCDKHMRKRSEIGSAVRQHLPAARLQRSLACSRSQQSASADYTRWQEQMRNHNLADKARTAASRICQTDKPPNPPCPWI